jgi:hypothetical protein
VSVKPKKPVTIAQLQAIDLSGPPKLFVVTVNSDTSNETIAAIIQNLKMLKIHETWHKLIVVRGDLTVSIMDDRTLNCLGLVRKLTDSTRTANARPA